MKNTKLRYSAIFNSPQAGFTLIELIIVLVIIGIGFGIAGIAMRSGGGFLELSTLAKDMSATLRYARSHAVAEKKTYSFVLWKEDKAYGLYTDFSGKGADEEAPPVIYKTLPAALEVNLKNMTDEPRIDFFPQGSSSGGTIDMKDAKGRAFTIVIGRITGKVEVKRN
ncbi:MAG: GspH/FimT family protein [Nitrospirae bacterium]|nr:GspH/FimT family protein [Nitrospirota bacterium]